MTNKEKEVIIAIIEALHQPRDRLGRIQGDLASSDPMRQHALSYDEIPHGGYDKVDQAVMLLQCLVGAKPHSIMETMR